MADDVTYERLMLLRKQTNNFITVNGATDKTPVSISIGDLKALLNLAEKSFDMRPVRQVVQQLQKLELPVEPNATTSQYVNTLTEI